MASVQNDDRNPMAATLVPWLGNHGLWLALLIFMGLRAVFLGVIYWRADRRAAFVPA